jgi:hypothetical protein
VSNSIRSVGDFLALLKGVKQAHDDHYMALCPGHHDNKPSLSIKEVDGRILVKCFAGCELVNILKPLGLEPQDLFLDNTHATAGIGGDASIGKGCQRVNGVNLVTLAEAKHLPVDFLKSLGVGDFKYNRRPAVRIPYYAEDNVEVAVRFRLTLTAETGAQRFVWRRGDHVTLHGLNRLQIIREVGWVLLFEGESDCWASWYYRLPALGIPGKSTWRSAWAEYLEGLDVYLWQEPDAEDLTLKVVNDIPDLHVIRAPDGIKDISEAHIQGYNIQKLIEEQKSKAESGQALKTRYSNAQLARFYNEARYIIEADHPLELVKNAIRGLGYGGDLKPALITYLAMTSRLLAMRTGAMPVHILLMGASSAGKNYTLDRVKTLLPVEAYYTIDAGSPRVLIYDDAPLKHKVLIFGEADSLPAGEDNPAASAIRNLLQDHYLHYSVVTRDKDTGDYIVRDVKKPGPTVLVTTSTRSLGAQLMSRLFTVEIPDSKEQIGAALATQAALETEGSKPPDEGLIAFQAYLQLKAPIQVKVPYAKELGVAMAKVASAPRILRDFARLLSLIKAVAIIHEHQREFDIDERIVATVDDYEIVRELVNEMYIDSSSGATSDVRKLVETINTLDGNRSEGERITNTTLAKQLGTGVTQVIRRAKKALKQGWLVNREKRKSYPADYAPGEPMPETEGLPILECNDTLGTVNNEAINGFSFETKRVDMLTPLTDDDTPPAVDSREAMLGMPISNVIKIWHSEGAPLIHLGPGENSLDLEELLSLPDVHERHLLAVKQWLDRVMP